MRFGSVPELGNARMTVQGLLHDSPLNAFAAPVNQPNFAQPRRVRLVEVFLYDRRHIAWGEGVQVEMIFDGNAVSHRVKPTSRVDTTR